MLDRRTLLPGLVAAPFVSRKALAQSALPPITIHKDPNCGCCEAWAQRLGADGFKFELINENAMNRLKARLGVPQALASCHTAEIGGYVIEGHVPPAEIRRLIGEKPAARGLAVPGMPVNSPGMEVPGAPDDASEVVLFGPSGVSTFARYAGARKL